MDAKSVMKTIELWARETRRLLQQQQEQAQASQPPQGDGDDSSNGNGGGDDGQNKDVDTSLGLSSSSSSSSAWEELEEEVLLGPAHLDEIGTSINYFSGVCDHLPTAKPTQPNPQSTNHQSITQPTSRLPRRRRPRARPLLGTRCRLRRVPCDPAVSGGGAHVSQGRE